MWHRLRTRLNSLSLAGRFMLASLIILAAGMFLIGEWVGQQIEDGVVHRTAATTALYVDSFISPDLQELADHDTLSPQARGPPDSVAPADSVRTAGGRVQGLDKTGAHRL